jgi:hypothetical protein
MGFKTNFGLLATVALAFNFLFYGGLILLAIWAIGKYLL